MRILVTGSAGHLGEGLVRYFKSTNQEVVGVDVLPSPFTAIVGSISDRQLVKKAMTGVDVVLHAATLHKPHVATHSTQDFVDTNISGTANLLDETVEVGVKSFVFTSTTSVFGRALTPSEGEPAAWIDEGVTPVVKNIYGATKAAAEDLCELFHRRHRIPCIVLRTSRFFPEEDDSKHRRQAYADDNLKANEMLHRRVDLSDAVSAHVCAIDRAEKIGFGKYIISATTPFKSADLHQLRAEAPAVVERIFPSYPELYDRVGWRMFPSIDRVYDNARARAELGWKPRYDFQSVLDCLRSGKDPRSPLARSVGAKGYHQTKFSEGPYPVEDGAATGD